MMINVEVERFDEVDRVLVDVVVDREARGCPWGFLYPFRCPKNTTAES